jgi:hypothetical protein
MDLETLIVRTAMRHAAERLQHGLFQSAGGSDPAAAGYSAHDGILILSSGARVQE